MTSPLELEDRAADELRVVVGTRVRATSAVLRPRHGTLKDDGGNEFRAIRRDQALCASLRVALDVPRSAAARAASMAPKDEAAPRADGLPGAETVIFRGRSNDDNARRRGDCHTSVPRDVRRDRSCRRSRIYKSPDRDRKAQDRGRQCNPICSRG